MHHYKLCSVLYPWCSRLSFELRMRAGWGGGSGYQLSSMLVEYLVLLTTTAQLLDICYTCRL